MTEYNRSLHAALLRTAATQRRIVAYYKRIQSHQNASYIARSAANTIATARRIREGRDAR